MSQPNNEQIPPSNTSDTNQIVREQKKQFIGVWIKTTETSCSRVYPTQIEFRENELYSATGSQPGPTPGWDVGTWHIKKPSQANISTANDAIITYQFHLQENTITFVDPAGCKITYKKNQR
jgi:hypothetical protein